MTQVLDQRRYDIDWLRNLAFLVLILYHVGMYYVADWGWHLKSENQSIWLQNLMLLTNPWRMSLLFVISGMATAMVDDKFSRGQLAKIRVKRILIPLLFGMFVVVAPQVYLEGVSKHALQLDYWHFWLEYVNPNTDLLTVQHTPIGLLTWNHLWYLPYLLCYSLVFLAISPLIKWISHCLERLKIKAWLVFISLVLMSTYIWWSLSHRYPTTHALVGDWYNHARYFWVFIVGYMIPKLPYLWDRLIGCRRVMLLVALAGYVWLLLDFNGLLELDQGLNQQVWVQLVHGLLRSLNYWAWILVCIAYAGRYLQFSNRVLQYANKAVLPWYILHQTLILMIAASLAVLHWPAWLEAPILVLLTCLGCWLGYELVSRFSALRFLFGLKS
ncbi:acyltransferase family protein [Paraglaciecola sp.]|uniref:acyltransferase family protein n=1 Tax=Paraglaciecola sp. TaxID=1920173 RepID=UPI003EF2FE58